MTARGQFIAGAVLLAAGVVLAAAAGSRLSSGDFDVVKAEGAAAINGAPVADAAAPLAPGARITAWSQNGLGLFSVGLLVMLGGALLARRGQRDGNVEAGTAAALDWAEMLDRLQTATAGLAHAVSSAAVEDLPGIRERLESVQEEVVEPLVDARGELQARHGLAGFAAVMGPLSGAERLLSRAWSALVDHHGGEAAASLTQACAALESAQAALGALEQ